MYKVLLVDDEPYVIEGLKAMIDWEKRGYQICGEASNGEDAFQMIRDFDPDLVVTDIRMPAMDGLQLIHQTREGGNLKVQFIILSGYDDFSYIQYAMKFGITDYLLKPIDDEEMRKALDRIQDAFMRSEGSSKKQIPPRGAPAREAPAGEDILTKGLNPETLSHQLATLANQGPGSENLVIQLKPLINIADDQVIRCLLLEIDSYAGWMDTLDEPEIYDKKMELKAILLESLPEVYRRRLFETEVHRFALIVSPQMEIYHQLGEYLANLQEVLKQRFKCSISMAISEAMPGLGSLGILYRQAALAIHYKFFHGEGSEIYFSDIKNTPLNDNFCNIPLDALLEDIKNNDLSGIHEKITNLFQDFTRNLCTPEVIKAYLQNLLLEVIKHSLKLNGDIGAISVQIMKLNERFEGGSAPTIGALQADFEELCAHAARYLSTISACDSQNIISAVKNYVKENYAKDISLQKLAKHFYMNPVYLGQLFKRYEGRQFSEYLHQTRIDEAKKLLRRTNMKISEIAYAIGYHDPEYFVSKFKSITQVPPSAFKKT